MKNWIENIKWTEDGLVPVIVQDHISNKVIMFAWMNRLSLEASIKQKKAIYWSRSRKKIWTKGESSGYYQHIKDMIIDCDKDVLLIKVKQEGGISCHTGRESCFYYRVDMESNIIEECEKVIKNPDEIYKDKKMKDEFLEHLLGIIKSKKGENPEKSYTAMLQQSDINETLKKIEEEAFEVIDAVKLNNKSNIVHEVADLWFHCLVVLAKKNLTVEDITNELKTRQGISGIEEKLNRTKKVK